MISFKKKFIHIHINKCAGRSIQTAILPYCSKKYNGHRPAKDFYNKIKKYDDFFVFAIVRNPWDRLLSHYFFSRQHCKANNIFLPVCYMSFIEWINDPGLFESSLLFSNQLDWLTYNDKIIVDYIGKFECLKESWFIISNMIGIKSKLTHQNKTEHNHYSSYYDYSSRKLIEKQFAPDISYFGYKFEQK